MNTIKFELRRKLPMRLWLPVLCCCVLVQPAIGLEPIPDKLVVLTFDDSVKSHFTVVRDVLQLHNFGATFFITEGFDFTTNKQDYMTWEEIAQLHRDGFEIGNHTRDHMSLNASDPSRRNQLAEQMEAINRRCKEHGIPPTTTFAYPGNGLDPEALPILKELGIQFARRGGAPEYPYQEGRGFAYEPGLDHPLLIPSAGDGRPDWTFDDFRRAVEQAKHGRIAVLQFHGAPDTAHSWVNTPPDSFRVYMQYLADNDYTVIALRDLARYVDPNVVPKDPDMVIKDRQRQLAAGKLCTNVRPPSDTDELRRWLENMVWHHRFTVAEVCAATGLPAARVVTALDEFNIRPETRPVRDHDAPLLTMPYPGGRHPRIGFLDGAVRPQRETKISVFAPWNERDYFVLDLPEAIRRNDEETHGLLYLAHTHVDTMWEKRGIPLETLEWERQPDGSLRMERTLPNRVRFGTQIIPTRESLRMEMWLHNGSEEQLSNLKVQNCVMLKGASGFLSDDDATLVRRDPYVARRSSTDNQWIVTAWTPCDRTWFNPPCPCLHSDGHFPDCGPGETKRLRGWFSFYEGDAIEAEFDRIDTLDWQQVESQTAEENGN
jgi:peptidoglycan/xylan/chitin deacetylase (PgdA/CDA1 family)